jgi:glycosyltransferase involved in cell wall biosynthesis
MPEVSVIIDNYNYARFISDAIDSVLKQTFSDFELIIVDDGSTDDSRKIIESYNDKRIVKVFKQNGGQTSAFNAGMEVVRGNIVAFLDSDDYWYENKLEIIVQLHNAGAAIVQHYLAENGERIYREIASDVDWSKVLVEYGYMYQHSPTSALSFRKSVIEHFFPLIDAQDMHGYSDGCILMLAMTNAKVTCNQAVCGYYRVHGNNLNAMNTDKGQKLKEVSVRQREYVNKQLLCKRQKPLIIDNGQYLRFLLDKVNFDDKPVVIYGTGNSGKVVCQYFVENNIPIRGFASSSGNDGAETPELLYRKQTEYGKIIVASSAQKDILASLLYAGIDKERIVTLEI